MRVLKKGDRPAYLITIACLKISANNFDEAYDKVMKSRSGIVKKFVIQELSETTAQLDGVAKDLLFDTILYEVDDITNFDTEAFYFNIKIYFALKPTRKKK